MRGTHRPTGLLRSERAEAAGTVTDSLPGKGGSRLKSALQGILLLSLFSAFPVAQAQLAGGDDYVLRNLDAVAIRIYGEPDLSKELRIDGSGQVRMGLIGTIGLAGLTLGEAEAKLEEAYVTGRYLREPQVTIEVREYAPLYVHVFGQVGQPGRVQLEYENTGMPLLDLISAVGGFTGLAKADAVRITRTHPVTGEETVVTVNAEALINGRNADIPAAYLTLQPGDVVYVPERLF